MRDVGCKLSGNLFQPPRRNKRFPAAASIRKSPGQSCALLRRRRARGSGVEFKTPCEV